MGDRDRVPCKTGLLVRVGKEQLHHVPSPPPRPDGAPPSNSRLGCCPTLVGPDRGGGLGPTLAPHGWMCIYNTTRLHFFDEQGGERWAPGGDLSVISAWEWWQGAFFIVVARRAKPDKAERGGGIFRAITRVSIC